MTKRNPFFGIYAPIATVFTPDDRIDWQAMAANIAHYSATNLAGLVVLGSNGEFAMMRYQEKVELIHFARKHLAPEKGLIIGTGCETTAETIELGKVAADAGADCALVLTPWYYKSSYNDSALTRHFTDIADASTIPVMLYNMPRNTNLNMNANLVCKLAAHPNIIGIKDSGGDIVQITNIINGTPEDFAVFAGSGSFLMATTLAGGVGGTLAVANIMPQECVDLFQASLQGDLVKARLLQDKLMKPNTAVTSGYGIAGLKKAMEMIGLHGGTPRLPQLPLSEAEEAGLSKVLQDVGLVV